MDGPRPSGGRQPHVHPAPSPECAPADRSEDLAANDDDPPHLRRCLAFLDRLFGEPGDDGPRN